MNLVEANEIIKSLSRFCGVINNTIGVIQVKYDILNNNMIQIEFTKNYINNLKEVVNFIFDKTLSLLNSKGITLQNDAKNEIKICYILDSFTPKTFKDTVIKPLIEVMYDVVDEAKVEFSSLIQICKEHNIPDDVYEIIDEYAQEQIENGILDVYENPTIYCYKMPISGLYSMVLGYNVINITNIETDLIPDFIGESLSIIDDFFYATSYEDEKNIYIYSGRTLDEDDIDDLMESFLTSVDLISYGNSEETLEDLWEDFCIENKNFSKRKIALFQLFELAKKNHYDIALELTVPTRDESEVIIVKNDNLDYKLNYYKENYNDNLELNRCTDIKILNATLIKWDISRLKVV